MFTVIHFITRSVISQRGALDCGSACRSICTVDGSQGGGGRDREYVSLKLLAGEVHMNSRGHRAGDENCSNKFSSNLGWWIFDDPKFTRLSVRLIYNIFMSFHSRQLTYES